MHAKYIERKKRAQDENRAHSKRKVCIDEDKQKDCMRLWAQEIIDHHHSLILTVKWACAHAHLHCHQRHKEKWMNGMQREMSICEVKIHK